MEYKTYKCVIYDDGQNPYDQAAEAKLGFEGMKRNIDGDIITANRYTYVRVGANMDIVVIHGP